MCKASSLSACVQPTKPSTDGRTGCWGPGAWGGPQRSGSCHSVWSVSTTMVGYKWSVVCMRQGRAQPHARTKAISIGQRSKRRRFAMAPASTAQGSSSRSGCYCHHARLPMAGGRRRRGGAAAPALGSLPGLAAPLALFPSWPWRRPACMCRLVGWVGGEVRGSEFDRWIDDPRAGAIRQPGDDDCSV